MGATLKRRDGSGRVFSGFEAVFAVFIFNVFCTKFRGFGAFFTKRLVRCANRNRACTNYHGNDQITQKGRWHNQPHSLDPHQTRQGHSLPSEPDLRPKTGCTGQPDSARTSIRCPACPELMPALRAARLLWLKTCSLLHALCIKRCAVNTTASSAVVNWRTRGTAAGLIGAFQVGHPQKRCAYTPADANTHAA